MNLNQLESIEINRNWMKKNQGDLKGVMQLVNAIKKCFFFSINWLINTLLKWNTHL